MNAEFLEKNIELVMLEENGVHKLTAKKTRKNLAPISFIGAFAVTPDGLTAYIVKSAKDAALPSPFPKQINVEMGPYILPYYPSTGTFGKIVPQ